MDCNIQYRFVYGMVHVGYIHSTIRREPPYFKYIFTIAIYVCMYTHFTINSSSNTIFVRSVGQAEVLLLVSMTKLAVSFSKTYINSFRKSASQT